MAKSTTPKSTTTKGSGLMELGDEVILLPPEEDEKEEKKKEEEEKKKKTQIKKTSQGTKRTSKEKTNQTGGRRQQQMSGKKKGEDDEGGGGGREWNREKEGEVKMKEKKASPKESNSTATFTTLMPTTTTTTPFSAEESTGEHSTEENKDDGIKPKLEVQLETNETAINNNKRLSYELAGGETNETERRKNAESEIKQKEEKSQKPKIFDQEWEERKATTGRQPLPEFDYITQKPPSEGDGCRTRNIDGEWVEHYPDSVFRQFHDWAGRCSSWCECSTNGTSQCHELGCLSDVRCEARHTTVGFGQRLYLEDRGACQCHDGRFICDSSELRPELGAGLYISLGYSKTELDLIRKKVPKPILERSGLISQSSSLVKDLATRLQFALERVLPGGMQCRVAVLEHFPPEQVVLMQLQWFGVDSSVNQSRPKWHSGKMEKHCSTYVRELELTFLLEQAPRYQLLLSVIKQIHVIDLLDALPLNEAGGRKTLSNEALTLFLFIIGSFMPLSWIESCLEYSLIFRNYSRI